MCPNAGALHTPVCSEGFVVLFPPPEGETSGAGPALARAGVRLHPENALISLGEARIHRIRCFRLALAGAVSLSLCEHVVLVVCGHGQPEKVLAGEGLVLDGARADAPVVLADARDMLLLALPRVMLASLAQQRLPDAPPIEHWPGQARFDAADSAFAMLMAYLQRLIADCPEQIEHGEIGVQIEEALAMELMRNWVDLAGAKPVQARASAVPRHVRLAESYMAAHAAAAPAIADVARAAGVSERVLSAAFRRFCGVTPSAHLRELRLCGVRAALEAAGRGETVASVAANWSYVNFGLFARAYANRFGELPSVTLRRARDAP